MAAQLAQICLFQEDGTALRQFCDIVSGDVEIDNGDLLSYHMGPTTTVAHHPPMGMLGENDVLVTLQVGSAGQVDRIHASLLRGGLTVDDDPENTDWGWRVFYFQAAPHVYFEVGAPL